MSTSDDIEFLEFLRVSLREPDIRLERLPVSCTSRVYRLRTASGESIFCKRGLLARSAFEFLCRVPPTPRIAGLARPDILEFRGEQVVFYMWCEVRQIPLVRMTDGQYSEFLAGYREISERMQLATDVRPPADARVWLEAVGDYCRRLPVIAWFIRRLLSLNPEVYAYPAGARLSVTHGDMHMENYGFTDRDGVRFLDFDLMIRAYPAEDLVNVFAGAVRRGRVTWNPFSRRRLLRRFEMAIRLLRYPPDQWQLAYNRARLQRIAQPIITKPGSLRAAFNAWRRDRAIRCLGAVIDRVAGVPSAVSDILPGLPRGIGLRALQTELERTLGFGISEFHPLKSVNSLNFRAVRDGDGMTFLVKLTLAGRDSEFVYVGTHLREMRGTRIPRVLFEPACRRGVLGREVLCLEWCEGRSKFPDELTEGEFHAFLSDYLEFSEALQRTTLTDRGYTPKSWRDGAIANCQGFCGRILRRLIEETTEDECCFRPERVRIIHGDLHPGNFVFRDGRVRAFFDLGGFAWGYPALDFIRYFGFSDEHLSVFRFVRRRRLFSRLAQAVRELPYPADEWIVAINATWMERIDKKLDERPVTVSVLLHLLVSARLYRKLRRIVRRASGSAEE